MEKVDVVVVGAGLAGLATAWVLAEAGVEVLVVERGDYPGSKNVTGGRLYLEPVRPYLPNLMGALFEPGDGAPFERRVVKERWSMLAPDAGITVEYNDARFREGPAHSVTVLHATFDQWLAEQVMERGALVIPGYKVAGVLQEEGRVVGIRTEADELHADVVVAADGVLSFTAEQAGLRGPHEPHHMAVGVKEVIELPPETIRDRFGLLEGEGAAQLFFGSITEGMLGGGFLYTNRESLSLGLVLGVGALVDRAGEGGAINPESPTPYELLEAFKARPEVQALIAGGHPVEYSAHLIPEGGVRGVPRLVGDGILVAGDAAGLALNQAVSVRGMDMALISGALAGRAILRARESGDFSAEGLAHYEATLKAAPIYRDLDTFRAMPEVLANPRLYEVYPQAACDLLREITQVGQTPQRRLSQQALRHLRRLFKPATLGDALRMMKI